LRNYKNGKFTLKKHQSEKNNYIVLKISIVN
jgi:hypothetical protein